MRTDNAVRHFMKRPNCFVLIGVFAVLATLLASEFLATSSAQRREKSSREALSTTANRGADSSGTATKPVNEEIQRFLSAAPSIFPLSAPLVPQAGPESIDTYLSNCTTAEVRFTTGDTVCVKVTNVSSRSKAIYWVNPDGAVVQRDDLSTNNPATRVVSQAGKWAAYLVGYDNEKRGVADFSVSDPQQPSVDLSV
ncbi:MAG: hypothetical protein DMF75_14025, partial [Acidobacteria bacterium]